MCRFNNAQSKAEKALKKRKTRDKKRLPFSQILKFGIAIEPPSLQYCAKYFTCFTIWAMQKTEIQYMQAESFLKELFDRLMLSSKKLDIRSLKKPVSSMWDILEEKTEEATVTTTQNRGNTIQKIRI